MPIAKKPRGPVPGDAAARAFIRGAEAEAEADRAGAQSGARARHKKPAMMRFDPELLRRVDKAAQARFQTRTAYITAAVVRALEEDGN